jgi:predicted amidohydrolase YtcJ
VVCRLSVSNGLLIRNVEIGGRPNQDCLVRDGAIAAVGRNLPNPGVDELPGRGGALLPGLADHHLHLFAMAAAAHSFDLSLHADLNALSRFNTAGGWVRVVGWDERHGDLDRDRLDALVGDRPVRVQHRSGALWVLNSSGLHAVTDKAGEPPDSAERDGSGRLTGRLWRADRWLRDAIGTLPDLADVGRSLASVGVTAVTDATPDHDVRALEHLMRAVQHEQLLQRVQLTCELLPIELPARVSIGPRKLVVTDHELPHLAELVAAISGAHAAERAVAVHCVSREALALTLAALHEAGTQPGDRIEHCAIADAAAVTELAALNLIVVTQPSLVVRRGDLYLSRHNASEHDDLWRHASLLAGGVPTVASSDAPYGDPDPWLTIRAARDRTTQSGAVLGAAERVPAEQTLAGLLSPLERPGGPPRTVSVGEPADLVLLKVPLPTAFAEPLREHVAATLVAGRVAYLD